MSGSSQITATTITPTSPASVFETAVPSDSVPLEEGVKAIYCLVDGTLNVTDWSDTPNTVAFPMIAGQQLNIKPRLILASGTTGTYAVLRG